MYYAPTAALLSMLVLVGCGDASANADVSAATPAAALADVANAEAQPGAPKAVGSITASFGGEDRSWTALYRVADGRTSATSTYQVRKIGGRETHMLSLGAHVGVTMSTKGSMRVRATVTTPLSDCPCEVSGSLEYVGDESKLWEGAGATVKIDAFSDNGDGTYSAKGSFSGTLPRDRNAADLVRVEGTFNIKQIMRVGPGA